MNEIEPAIGILGGSGLYEIDALGETEWVHVDSPYGEPSDEFLTGRLDGQRIVFLPRHGRGHHLSPSTINYRANIDGFKRLGVTQILSLSAVGSLREDMAPGHFVLIDQYIDRTRARPMSFFDEGIVAHVSMASPSCARMTHACTRALAGMDLTFHEKATYLVMEGPQFSTRAESHLYRSWGCDVIGMTNMPEARLAREAEICYLSVGMVTDYDCWRESEEVVVEAILAILRQNAAAARALVCKAVPLLDGGAPSCPNGCRTVLDFAIVTPPEHQSETARSRLDAVCARPFRS